MLLRTVCRGAVCKTRQSMQDHVWISDDLLASSFWHFVNPAGTCTLGRRNASCVPGVLEARRRLAKRRLMNLTVAGARSDPGIWGGGLFDPANWTWEPPTPQPDTESIVERGWLDPKGVLSQTHCLH